MFADIHTHILPGLDDGAGDIVVALEMLRHASLNGTRHIVVTPHFTSADTLSGGATLDISAKKNTSDIIDIKVNELKKAAAFHNIDISIYPGAEVLLSPDILPLLAERKICTINGTRYVLIEFPLSHIPVYTRSVLYQIQLDGFVPIIAHPERYFEIMKHPNILKDFTDRGMLVQVNAGSLTGVYGRKVRKVAMKLIKAGIVHFVASDAHGTVGRPPELGEAAGVIEKKFGVEAAERLFCKNALDVLENRLFV